jgi:hypothetical protein
MQEDPNQRLERLLKDQTELAKNICNLAATG